MPKKFHYWLAVSARRATVALLGLIACLPPVARATSEARIRDITTVEGIRENPLVGYGMVVGLNGTGDRSQTLFSTQTLTSILKRMGIQVPASSIRINNVASVMVTAVLPPFAHTGMKIDVTISSIGDAKSLEGGLLLLTPLFAADGQAYAASQGPITLGGYSAGQGGTGQRVNHPTVGRIPEGAIIEKAFGVELSSLNPLRLLLRQPDFSSAANIAKAINANLGENSARVADSRLVEIDAAKVGQPAAAILAAIENLPVQITPPSKVVINERTGTVVMGRDVKLGAVSVLHGNLTIETTTVLGVSQPGPLSNGETVVAPQTGVRAEAGPAKRLELESGASVEDLVRGLQTIGATARDIVAILQAIKAAGGLQAELEII